MKYDMVISNVVARAIAQHCIAQNGKCDECIYSIKHLKGDFSRYRDCIFDNCPDSWRIKDEVSL